MDALVAAEVETTLDRLRHASCVSREMKHLLGMPFLVSAGQRERLARAIQGIRETNHRLMGPALAELALAGHWIEIASDPLLDAGTRRTARERGLRYLRAAEQAFARVMLRLAN